MALGVDSDAQAASLDRILRGIANLAIQRARANCQSRTLRRAIEATALGPRSWAVGVPHFWAPYFHDGRGGFTMPRPGRPRPRIAVWFKNPRNDPRLSGGYPVLPTDVRHLSKSQFRAAIARDQVIVARRIGPTAKPLNPFLKRAFTGIVEGGAGDVAAIEVSRTVMSAVRGVERAAKARTVTLRLL